MISAPGQTAQLAGSVKLIYSPHQRQSTIFAAARGTLLIANGHFGPALSGSHFSVRIPGAASERRAHRL
jgi:hypothetical protein